MSGLRHQHSHSQRRISDASQNTVQLRLERLVWSRDFQGRFLRGYVVHGSIPLDVLFAKGDRLGSGFATDSAWISSVPPRRREAIIRVPRAGEWHPLRSARSKTLFRLRAVAVPNLLRTNVPCVPAPRRKKRFPSPQPMGVGVSIAKSGCHTAASGCRGHRTNSNALAWGCNAPMSCSGRSFRSENGYSHTLGSALQSSES
jgi:hypothetical protein